MGIPGARARSLGHALELKGGTRGWKGMNVRKAWRSGEKEAVAGVGGRRMKEKVSGVQRIRARATLHQAAHDALRDISKGLSNESRLWDCAFVYRRNTAFNSLIAASCCKETRLIILDDFFLIIITFYHNANNLKICGWDGMKDISSLMDKWYVSVYSQPSSLYNWDFQLEIRDKDFLFLERYIIRLLVKY